MELARGADLFLAEATFPEEVTENDPRYLSTARPAFGGEVTIAAGGVAIDLS